MELTINQALQKAVSAHQSGDLPAAEGLYKAILTAQPNHPDANHNLGVLTLGMGKFDKALPFLKAALKVNAKQDQYWVSYIHALIGANLLVEAKNALKEARRLVLSAEQESQIEKKLQEIKLHQKNIKKGKSKSNQVINAAKNKAAQNALASPSAQEINALLSEYNSGKFDLTKKSAELLIAKYPKHPFAWKALGAIFQQIGRPQDALIYNQQAVLLNLNDAVAYNNLGSALNDLGRHEEAETILRQAIALKPDFAEAYSNLGNALNELRRHEEAETNYRQAIALKPDYAVAYSNLGSVLNDLGRHEEAETNYRQAIALKPDSIEYIIREKLLLPDIYTSASNIDEWRQRYQLGLEAINVLNLKINTPIIKISNCTFNLAYHNLCNLKLIQKRSILTRRSVTNVTYTSPHVMQWTKPVCRKIRIAFCSRYMVMHTIGKLYQGLIKKLDRSIFELILIHTPSSKLDNLSQQLDQAVDKAIFLSPTLSIQHEQIAMEKLDILFYPDIGMEPETYHLAHARLAPIQIVSWGHPDSSGIDSLDYFLSSSLIEPENAGQYYSEKLIKLNRLPTYYEPPIAATQFDDRTSLGLPTRGTLYGCPQSLFKIHPDFDPILANILYKDSTAHLIFLEGKTSAWSSLLRKRWGAHYPAVNERVIFLPRLPMDKFMALMGKMDILLDPIHFGSGNTFYESMIYGVPTVTWPGQFMRGRIVAGAYKQMGITDAPIAERLTDYANLAVELGNDDEKRSHLKERLQNAAKEHLFSDISIVQEVEKFFLAAIDVADKGEKLKTGWIPK